MKTELGLHERKRMFQFALIEALSFEALEDVGQNIISRKIKNVNFRFWPNTDTWECEGNSSYGVDIISKLQKMY